MNAETAPSPIKNRPSPGKRVVEYLVSQFHRPRGPVGRLAGRIMAARGSNVDRNLWLVGLLELEPDHRVLEIGPGPGVALAAVGETVTNGQIVGIDHSTTMLSQATARNRSLIAADRLRLLAGSAEVLPADLGRFDRIYCMNVWQFWPDPAPVIAGLAQLLATDGKLAFGYQPRHPGAPDTEEAERQLRSDLMAVGLKNIDVNQMDIDPPVVAVIGQ